MQAWLVGEGKVAMERVFLMAPKLKPDEKDEGKGGSASRVDFSLR